MSRRKGILPSSSSSSLIEKIDKIDKKIMGGVGGEHSCKTHGLYMDESVFEVFTLYAGMKKPREAYKVWADALLTYMEENPVDELNIIIKREIASSLPRRQEALEMSLLTRDIEFAIERLKTGNYPEMQQMIINSLKKGVKIKNPTGEFIELLEKAENYV